jgi:hypothetical protein
MRVAAVFSSDWTTSKRPGSNVSVFLWASQVAHTGNKETVIAHFLQFSQTSRYNGPPGLDFRVGDVHF